MKFHIRGKMWLEQTTNMYLALALENFVIVQVSQSDEVLDCIGEGLSGPLKFFAELLMGGNR